MTTISRIPAAGSAKDNAKGALRPDGTFGFFLAFIMFPAVPILALQLFIDCSSRITLPFFLLAGFLCLKSRIAASALVIILNAVGTVMFLTSVFRLSLVDTITAIVYDSGHISPLADPLYAFLLALGFASMFGTLAVAWLYRPRPKPVPTFALALGTIFAVALPTANLNSQSFQRPQEGAPMRSAISESGFRSDVLGGKNPALFVMVEGLGVFREPAYEDLILRPVLDLAGSRKVTRGRIPSAGSTTAGEIRELCGVYGTHSFALKGGLKTDLCLPKILGNTHRPVIAIHGFKPTMFDREVWYPRIGLKTNLFGLEAAGTNTPQLCSSVFRGPCDFEIAPVVSRNLEDAEAGRAAPFVYWLTLNSHAPAVPHEGLKDPFQCGDEEATFKDRDVCALAVIWHDAMERVAAIAREHPDADILLTGDHPPPILSRAAQSMFHEADVPWIRLEPASHPLGNADPQK